RLELLENAPRAQAVVIAAIEMSDYRRARPGRSLGFAFVDYANTMVAGVAEVSVDRASGVIRVHQFWCAIDPGIAVQPDNIVAQTEGSIVYGLGLALTERISIKDGVVQQSNFYDYRVPRRSIFRFLPFVPATESRSSTDPAHALRLAAARRTGHHHAAS